MRIWRTSAVTTILALAISVPQPAQTAGRGQAEGIKVHGGWTIELHNPDGTRAARHEFNNALLPQGGDFLARILGAGQTVGVWGVTLSSVAGQSPCGVTCFLRQDAGPNDTALVVEVPAAGPHAGRLVMRGHVVATQDGSIQSVVTQQLHLQIPFSERFLAPVIPVVAGQGITITVVFSFS
jgi:hypothetical protein